MMTTDCTELSVADFAQGSYIMAVPHTLIVESRRCKWNQADTHTIGSGFGFGQDILEPTECSSG